MNYSFAYTLFLFSFVSTTFACYPRSGFRFFPFLEIHYGCWGFFTVCTSPPFPLQMEKKKKKNEKTLLYSPLTTSPIFFMERKKFKKKKKVKALVVCFGRFSLLFTFLLFFFFVPKKQYKVNEMLTIKVIPSLPPLILVI